VLGGHLSFADESAERCTSLGQVRVDEIQAAVRSGAALPAEAGLPAGPVDVATIDMRIAAELAGLKRMLDGVGEELADDIEVLMRHERALQQFDIVAQSVQYLADVMAAPDRAKAAGDVPMHDLRSRLLGVATSN
jgi:hypothetical protein